MDHRKAVARIVWWLNHHESRHFGWQQAECAGYAIVEVNGRGFEFELDADGCPVAVLRRTLDGEWVAFVFTPEGGVPRWREWLWRVTHPLTRRTEPQWPRRNGVSVDA